MSARRRGRSPINYRCGAGRGRAPSLPSPASGGGGNASSTRRRAQRRHSRGRVPSPACGGGRGRGPFHRSKRKDSPLPNPPPQPGEGVSSGAAGSGPGQHIEDDGKRQYRSLNDQVSAELHADIGERDGVETAYRQADGEEVDEPDGQHHHHGPPQHGEELRMPGRDSNHSATFRSGMEHARGTFRSSRGCVRDAALGKLLSRTRRPLRQPLHRACHVWARRYQDAGNAVFIPGWAGPGVDPASGPEGSRRPIRRLTGSSSARQSGAACVGQCVATK